MSELDLSNIDLSKVGRVKLLKANAMRFEREEVMAVLDIVGREYFHRQLAFTSEEAIQTLIAELAHALGALPAEVRAPLRQLIADM